MDKEITLPNVDIVEQARKIGSEDSDDLAVMQYIAQATIAAQAVKVRKYFDDRTSDGFTQNFALVVTPVAQRVKCDFPSQTLYVINDMPVAAALTPIFIEINVRFKTATQLNNGEDMFIDFETHKLIEFWVYCLPAAIAPARAFAKR